MQPTQRPLRVPAPKASIEGKGFEATKLTLAKQIADDGTLPRPGEGRDGPVWL